MLTPEQQALRKQGVGASEVGAILGLDPHRTALDVWLEKRGMAPERAQSEAATMGHLLEPVVAQRYLLERPSVTLTEGQTVIGEEPYFLATPDRIAEEMGHKWLLEIKTRSVYSMDRWGEAGTDQIPPEVLCQVLWQQVVTGMHEMAEVAVLIGGNTFRLYQVGYDAEVAASMQEQVRDFWLKNVQKGIEPALKGPSAVPYLRKKWQNVEPEMLEANAEVEETLKRLALATQMASTAEKMKEEAQVALMAQIGDKSGTIGETGRVSWRHQKGRTTVDWQGIAKSLGAELPSNADLVSRHTKVGDPIRVFRFTPSGA